MSHWKLPLCSLMLLSLICVGCTGARSINVATLTAPDEAPAHIVSGALDANFERWGGDAIPVGSVPGRWWRISPDVPLEASLSPRLELSDVYLARVEVWRRGGAEPAQYSTYGPDATERYSTRGLTIALSGGIAAREPVYLRIEARGIAPIRVAFETLVESRRNDARHTQIRSVLLTVMLVTTVLALGFGLGLGERSYFYFAVMALCQVAHLALIGGEARYLPGLGDSLDRNLQAARVAASLGTIASIEFMRMYLDLVRRQPMLSRVLLACSLVLGINALASLVTAASWTALLGNVTLLISAASLLTATIRGCIARQRAAWFVLIAWVPAMVLATLRAAQSLGLLAGPDWLTYLFPMSFAFACLLLTLGLTERMLTIRRERHEAMLESQRRALQLATASHDIRQPLLALRTALARLSIETGLAPNVVERFRNSIQYLDKLATQYTTPAAATAASSGARGMSRSESAPAAEAETLPVDLLLRNIDLMFRDEAEAKGLAFRLRSSTVVVTADPMAAMRIVSNLVANAVKYTHTGKILVGCRRHGNRLAIVIADTGRGMTRDELTRVFKEGERGSNAGDTEGSGLGLSIVTRLAAERGYDLHVASKPGRGTVFSLELPRG